MVLVSMAGKWMSPSGDVRLDVMRACWAPAACLLGTCCVPAACCNKSNSCCATEQAHSPKLAASCATDVLALPASARVMLARVMLAPLTCDLAHHGVVASADDDAKAVARYHCGGEERQIGCLHCWRDVPVVALDQLLACLRLQHSDALPV